MVAPLAGPGVARQRALRLAHRGDWRRRTENTLPAFLAALAIPGCDGLEFDVQAARGGVAVCNHDDTLTRVHGVDRRGKRRTPHQPQAPRGPPPEAPPATPPPRALLPRPLD